MERIGLVLEGGGMRGVFTGGVLDVFLEEKIEFPYIVGVSAGACNAVSYVSHQYQRNYRINTIHIKDKRYLSLGNLLKTGSLFGVDMLFNIIPNQLEPLDYEAYRSAPNKLVVGATNCITGCCEYFPVPDLELDYKPVEASMSLPLVSNVVEYHGVPFLDGGVSDPIPVRKSILDGNTKNVIVLTQHKEYRKKPTSTLSLLKAKYKKYPRLVEAMERRHLVYNETLDYIKKLEAAGNAFVIRPAEPVDIGRFEKHPEKLAQLYKDGYHITKKQRDALRAFMGEKDC